MQRAHLCFHVTDVRVGHADGATDRRVDVVVELPAVAGEVLDERRRALDLELHDLDRGASGVVGETGLGRVGATDRDD